MALYAFDGTWNAPDANEDDVDKNTNVYRFLKFYGPHDGPPDAEPGGYIPGVGTRLGVPGRIVGGFFGAGGRSRIQEMLESFRANWRLNTPESRTVDVIGFSRGAALALAFCNKLADGVDVDGQRVTPPIRFLGLWDVVPSFGFPGVFISKFHEANVGWTLGVPATVQHCFHAMALDERRGAFGVHRLDPEGDDAPQIQEWWFRGVHSDVGGGNNNSARSNLTLAWMLERAAECGLPIARDRIAELVYRDDAPISHGSEKGAEHRRDVLKRDRVHPSAGRSLQKGEKITVEVDSRLWFDFSGVLVEKGATYCFTPSPDGEWTDKTIKCGASGWPKERDRGETVLGWVKSKVLGSESAGHVKRVPKANWFEMIACLGTDGRTTVPIGRGQYATAPWTAPGDGPLFFFANDVKLSGFGHDFYKNNAGTITVTVERLG